MTNLGNFILCFKFSFLQYDFYNICYSYKNITGVLLQNDAVVGLSSYCYKNLTGWMLIIFLQ